MADKAVSELVAAEQITETDLFVLEQNGTAKKLTGQILLNWLTKAADGHGGISGIAKVSTSGLADTYRITLADTTTFDFVVTNGKGISSITKTSTSGLMDTYTIKYNDGTSGTFTVTNGAKGDPGDNAYVWIKYASQEPTQNSHSFGDVPDDWIGVYFGFSSAAPTDWHEYSWYKIRGAKGDPGDPATLVSATVTYQVGDSGTIIPSGSWSTSIPTVAQGKYLWTKMVQQFNTGDPITAYSVARMGIDGLGSVASVAGISPDADGNVPLSAEDVKALPIGGGFMEGGINMNGQKLNGLNAPTEDTEAATKGYTLGLVKKAAPRNLLNNSDFLHFIAQAGIGGLHGTQAYAGDRWILDSGTLTGTANANGDGYSNIKLNGTIRQKVANAPSVATAGIEMVSGTATISYSGGEVTITSAGGVIRGVMLFDGERTLPEYQTKGYAAELAECQRYFYRLKSYWKWAAVGICSSATAANIVIELPQNMRIMPTVTIADSTLVKIRCGAVVSQIPSAISWSNIDTMFRKIQMTATVTGVTDGYVAVLYLDNGGQIEFSADL